MPYLNTFLFSFILLLNCRVSGSWGYQCHSDCCSAGHVCDCGLDCHHSTKMFCFLKSIKSGSLPKYTLVQSSSFLHACIFCGQNRKNKGTLAFQRAVCPWTTDPHWTTATVPLSLRQKGFEKMEFNDCTVGCWEGGTSRLTDKLLQASSS